MGNVLKATSNGLTLPAKKPVSGGLISQLVNRKKPNMQKAQRMNPSEVPTRKLY